MKKAMVLVTLFIRVAIGFNASSTVSKSFLSTNITNENKRDVIKSRVNTTTGRPKELPSNRTDIDENDLYEHASAKQNNQSERAFIYINQKYKKPSLHQYFRVGQTGPEFMGRFSMVPPAMAQNFVLHHTEPCKSQPVKVTSYFQEYDIPGRLPDIASYFAAPKLYNCNKGKEATARKTQNSKGASRNEKRINNYNNYKNPNNQNINPRKTNQQRDYIELLKSPLLRPSQSNQIKPKYDGSPVPQISPLNYKDFLKLNQIYKQYNPKAKPTVDERKVEARNNYGYKPYAHPYYQNKRRLQVLEDSDFDRDLGNDDNPRTLDKTQDEELLDQYLKDALEDQISSKEVSTNDCRQHDCNMHNGKNSYGTGSSKDNKKVDCKCGWQPKQNKKEVFIPKDRSEREESKCNQTNTNKPSDITYYEEILTEDSTNKKNGVELKLINKLNNTLYR